MLTSDATPADDVVREITAAGGEAVASTDSVATPAGGKAIIDTALDTTAASTSSSTTPESSVAHR